MSKSIEVFLCTCNGSLLKTIDFVVLSTLIKDRKPTSSISIKERLCDEGGLRFITGKCKDDSPDGVVIGACAPESLNIVFKLAVEDAGIDPLFLETVSLREWCAFVHEDKRLSTEKAAFLVLSRINRLEKQEVVPPESVKVRILKPKAIDRRAFFKLLAKGFAERQALPIVDRFICLGPRGCKSCVESCPLLALSIVGEERVPSVDSNKCRGCGLCAPSCPIGAIELPTCTHEQIVAQVEALSYIKSKLKPKIITFACAESERCLNSLGERKMKYPPNILPVTVPCIGILSVPIILYAFNRGADAILIARGLCDKCPYKVGGDRAEDIASLTNALLDNYGIESSIKVVQMSPDNFEEFIIQAKELTAKVHLPPVITEKKIPYVRGGHEQLLLLLNVLSESSIPRRELVEVPYLGMIGVDKEKCTLCGACALKCPTEAIEYDSEKAKLTFNHRYCIACEVCKMACPEEAIKIQSMANLRLLRENIPCTLMKSELVLCSRCGKPIASALLIKKLEGILKKSFERTELLTLCDDCKRFLG